MKLQTNETIINMMFIEARVSLEWFTIEDFPGNGVLIKANYLFTPREALPSRLTQFIFICFKFTFHPTVTKRFAGTILLNSTLEAQYFHGAKNSLVLHSVRPRICMRSALHAAISGQVNLHLDPRRF